MKKQVDMHVNDGEDRDLTTVQFELVIWAPDDGLCATPASA